MRYLLKSDMNATTRKATPAQKTLPVRNQTTRAIMPAGKTNRIIFASTTIITIPMMTNRSSIARSPMFGNEGSWKPNKSKKLTTILDLKSIFKHFQKRKRSQSYATINCQTRNKKPTRLVEKEVLNVKLKYSQTLQSTNTLTRRH